MNVLERQPLWTLRVLWVLGALAAVGPLGHALDDRSTAVAATAVALLGLGWTGALVAMLVPRSPSLTAVRVLVPAAALATGIVVAWGPTPSPGGWVAMVAGILATGLALSPPVADALVDGSSYGPERRIPLRTPVAMVALGCATWVLSVAGIACGPLLLAAGAVPLGSVATLIGGAVAFAGVRSLHQLSRRWLVLVPTGMVLHDPLTMPEPQLFLRQTMARLGPARLADEDPGVGTDRADPDATTSPAAPSEREDLTAGASGLVMELELAEPVELLVYTSGRSTTLRPVTAVRFTPARPAVLLREASQRRLPVG